MTCALMTTSCKKDDKEMDKITTSVECENFIKGEDQPSIYFGDGAYQTIDIESDQITYSEDRSIYMVSDMEYTQSYTLQIEGDLTLNSTLQVEYISVGISDLEESASIEMEVVNVDASNQTVWLWNEDSTLGFILLFEPVE